MTTKRPLTIYGCSTDQKNECDYKYLARVWFYRTVTLFIVGVFGSSAYGVWQTASWKTQNENDVSGIKQEIVSHDVRIKNVEKTISAKLDTLLSRIK